MCSGCGCDFAGRLELDVSTHSMSQRDVCDRPKGVCVGTAHSCLLFFCYLILFTHCNQQWHEQNAIFWLCWLPQTNWSVINCLKALVTMVISTWTFYSTGKHSVLWNARPQTPEHILWHFCTYCGQRCQTRSGVRLQIPEYTIQDCPTVKCRTWTEWDPRPLNTSYNIVQLSVLWDIRPDNDQSLNPWPPLSPPSPNYQLSVLWGIRHRHDQNLPPPPPPQVLPNYQCCETSDLTMTRT